MPIRSEQLPEPLDGWVSTIRGPALETDAGNRESLSILVGVFSADQVDLESYVESFRSRAEESGLRVLDAAMTSVAGRPARRLLATQQAAEGEFQLLMLAAEDGTAAYEVRCGSLRAVFPQIRRACRRTLRSFTMTQVDTGAEQARQDALTTTKARSSQRRW